MQPPIARRAAISVFVLGVLGLAYSLGAAACGGCTAGLEGTLEETTDRTLAVLDEAIRALADSSADWEGILQDAMDQLTEEAQSTVRNEISNTLNRAIAATSLELRCDIDFLRNRVRQDLMRIKAALLGQEGIEIEPSFCSVVPSAVDLNLAPERRTLLEWYGYDFDTDPAVQVLLMAGDQTSDVSAYLDHPTHYHMTLNLGGSGVQLGENSQRFIVRWKDRDMGTIAIVQPTTPVCRQEVIHIQPSPITFLPPYVPAGDREYGGNGPYVEVHVRINNFGSDVRAEISMLARETKHDWTTASGSTESVIYAAPPGWRVEAIVGETYCSVSYIDNDNNIETFYASDPVHRFEIMGDGRGDDAGIHTRVTVHFDRIYLQIVENTDCISETALEESEEAGLLSSMTIDRLEPQIMELEQEVEERIQPVTPVWTPTP